MEVALELGPTELRWFMLERENMDLTDVDV